MDPTHDTVNKGKNLCLDIFWIKKERTSTTAILLNGHRIKLILNDLFLRP